MRTTSRLLATALTFAALFGTAAWAQQPPTPTVRIRGAIEAVDGNVLSMGERTITEEEALRIVQVWLTTDFEGGRHLARLRKIDGV